MLPQLAAVTLASLIAMASAQGPRNTTVEVGGTMTSPGGIFVFSPNNITVPNNSTVTFNFSGAPGNHSITQSSLESPCQPLAGGFDSGWVFVGQQMNPTAQWNLTITNASQPIYFFCKQLIPTPHCQAGMVGAINVDSNTFSTYLNNAKSSQGTPGQGQNGLVGIGASASAFPSPIPSGESLAVGPSGTASGGGTSSTGSPSAAILSSAVNQPLILFILSLTALVSFTL